MQTERSIPDLAKDMAHHLGEMFRSEVKLAKLEATEGVKSLGGGFVLLGAGVAFAAAALTLALMAAAQLLAPYMPVWAGYTTVALVGGGIAWLLIGAGKKAMTPSELTLPRTREQVSRDVETLTEHVHS